MLNLPDRDSHAVKCPLLLLDDCSLLCDQRGVLPYIDSRTGSARTKKIKDGSRKNEFPHFIYPPYALKSIPKLTP
jgi:hypothetical protein